MTAPQPRQPTVILNAPSVKVDAAYGRIYVSGAHAHLLRGLPGAFEDERRRGVVQLSLTLDSLRAIRTKLGVTKEQMARYCTPQVMRWAKAAGESERRMTDLHRRISTGWRAELPWADTRAGTPAPENAPASQCQWNEADKVWAYRNPFAHQQVMASVALELDGCAFLCEQGTGKTRAAIEAMRAKMARGDVECALVLSPKGVMNTWQRELAWWAPDVQCVPLRGPLVDRRRIVDAHANGGIRAQRVCFVLNYEALANEEMVAALVALMGRRRAYLVCDEMHKLKNPQAQQTQAAMELTRHAAARLGQTGTPVANGAQDVWSQWYVVDLGQTFGANFVQFRREFFNEYEWSWTVAPREGTLDRIGQKLRLRGIRYRKEDCLDLPPKVYEVEEVEMTAEQTRAYEEMRRWLVAWLNGNATEAGPLDRPAEEDEIVIDRDGRRATAANQLVAIMRLTQITSGFLMAEDGGVHRFEPNPKLARCEEIVRDHVRGGRQVIVWAHYRNDIVGIIEKLGDLGVARIDGSQQGRQGDIDRANAERAFQEGRARVLVANPAAGGVGLNLQAASVAIYYSQGYSLINRQQSEDRCHRAGSEIHNRVTYIDLSCAGTIDEVVRDAIAGKKEVAAAVVDLRRALGAAA